MGELTADHLRGVLTVQAGEVEGPWAVRGVIEQVRHHLEDDGSRTTRVVLEGASQLTRYEFDSDREVTVAPWSSDVPNIDWNDDQPVDVDDRERP